MDIYEVKSMGNRIHGNEYVGRGIVIGMTEDASKCAIAYFIMGRSENSRNRVFKKEGDNLTIYPFDESKVEDPSLIIYNPVMVSGNKTIVTNGDQTTTIFDKIDVDKAAGKCTCYAFEKALKTREFEPDSPNWTPRISGIVKVTDEEFSYKLSILKSADREGTACNRFTFDYEPLPGVGHFIHTYVCDGNPIPTFQGEPERVTIPDDIDEFYDDIWNNLDANNKISLYVRYIDLETGKYDDRLINKNK